MVEQRIQQQFFDGADAQFQAAEALGRPVAEATSALLAALTNGAKVMSTGAGAGAALSTYFAGLLASRFERDRPPLAALALDPLHAVRDVRALGLPGDVLLYIDDGEGHSSRVVSAAQDKDMTVVVVAGRGAHAFGELLAETDVLVAVPHERPARVAELQMVVVHALCDAIDFQLMGDQDL